MDSGARFKAGFHITVAARKPRRMAGQKLYHNNIWERVNQSAIV